MDRQPTKRILRPDNALHTGFWKTYRDILIELASNAWLIHQLIKRDMSSYRQSLLGIYWTIVIPFLSIFLILSLQSSNLFLIGNLRHPYALFAVTGLMFWQLFSTGVISATESLINARELVLKINISRKAVVIASLGKAAIGFSIQFALLVLLFLFYKIPPTPYILLIPFMIIPICLLTLSIGLVLSLLNCIIRDIGMGLSFLITVFLFLTPVLYVKPTGGWLSAISHYNPVYYLIELPRELILTGRTSNGLGYAVSIGVTLVLFVETLRFFHLSENRIAEKI
ncbi:MAG TPA: ABC transporter permease [Candidatus Omnitrophota bacterium]|nr:ABC transporter permease [Candidatus Omnitrophota bacterium]HSA31222.1 ABC transporter permease [Candidatus Omnitrophota bacterium]